MLKSSSRTWREWRVLLPAHPAVVAVPQTTVPWCGPFLPTWTCRSHVQGRLPAACSSDALGGSGMKLNRCWDTEAKCSEGGTATAERHPASASGASGGITKLGVFEKPFWKMVEKFFEKMLGSAGKLCCLCKSRGLPWSSLLPAAIVYSQFRCLSWKWKGIFEASCAECLNLIIWSICNNCIVALIFIDVVVFANC